MKKSKILMPIIGIAAIGSTIVPLTTLTSCNKGSFNIVSLAEGSTQAKEIGFKASYAYYNFKQENGKEAESTKVKIAKLIANDAEVTPVAGLVKSSTDSAGNISVKFDLATFKAQYQATKASFDLLFVNEKAGTSYTLTGFSAYFSETEEVKEEDYWKMYDERFNAYVNRIKSGVDYTDVDLDLNNDWIYWKLDDVRVKINMSQFTTLNKGISYTNIFSGDYVSASNWISGELEYESKTYTVPQTPTIVGGIPTVIMRDVIIAQIVDLVKSKESTVDMKYYMDSDNNLGLRISAGDKVYFDGAVNEKCYIVHQKIPQQQIQITMSGSTFYLWQCDLHFTYSKK